MTSMASSPASNSTLQHDSFVYKPLPSTLDLSRLPSTFVLPTHLSETELHETEDALIAHGASLTYNIREANLILGNISKARRARFELKCHGVLTQDSEENPIASNLLNASAVNTPPNKRRRLNNRRKSSTRRLASLETDDASTIMDSTTDSSTEAEADLAMKPMSQLSVIDGSISPNAGIINQVKLNESALGSSLSENFRSKVRIVKLEWFHRSLSADELQQMEPYTVYEGHLLPLEQSINSQRSAQPPKAGNPTLNNSEPSEREEDAAKGVMERAKADAYANVKPLIARARTRDRVNEAAKQAFAGRSFASSAQVMSQKSRTNITRPTKLLHQTTSEHDAYFASSPPALPEWVKDNKIYSCERATPLHSPNEAFIEQLKKIRLARLLTGDEIGVRAYSTSIASLAAYPSPFLSSREILLLPGCDQKIARLFQEWQSDGSIQAVADIDADPALQVLRLFYDIWGVGAPTAREFYYDRKWRDLDDIIEQGWRSLTRVQQIGVKYYDEFQLRIPRLEVESIAATIAAHARRLTDSSLVAVIVGGHRRGKAESGDVDVILTHPVESVTHNLVADVVASLESSNYITHVLTLALTNSTRDQQPLPARSLHRPAGHGFDTLDKALVVWQDPAWPSRAADLAADPGAKNPAPHRRVDIIVSPWRTIGCAVAGWTSGTTFQRDLRRYAKKTKGWKFDSSGVRERASGRWVDLEGWADERTRCTDWRVAEKRVFEGLGLVFREPEDRCTG